MAELGPRNLNRLQKIAELANMLLAELGDGGGRASKKTSKKVAKSAKAATHGDAPAPTLAQAEAATSDITFADLGLSEAMLASLLKSGYARPTPIQAQAVPLALK
jgi:superfamily II DNA/RNA helicase